LVQIFALILILQNLAFASPAKDCFINSMAELNFLRQFRYEEMDFSRVQGMSFSSANVFLATSSRGERYILRFPGWVHNPEYENFASQFIQSAPNTRTPQIRLLSETDSKDLLAKIRVSNPHLHKQIVAEMTSGESMYGKQKFRISVANYFPSQTGKAFLDNRGIEDPLHNVIYRSLRDQKLNPGENLNAKYKKGFADAWIEASETDIKWFVQDIKKIIPITSKMNNEEIVGFFVANIGNLDPKIEAELFYRTLERIPATVRTQLSDLWCMNSVLGLNDSHSKNWLIRNGQVLSIDLSDKTDAFVKGETFIAEQQYPVGFLGTAEIIEKFLKRHASKETQNYIKNLTREQILEDAKKAGYKITETEIKGMLDRAKALNF
jgi:hypothetical protein